MTYRETYPELFEEYDIEIISVPFVTLSKYHHFFRKPAIFEKYDNIAMPNVLFAYMYATIMKEKRKYNIYGYRDYFYDSVQCGNSRVFGIIGILYKNKKDLTKFKLKM